MEFSLGKFFNHHLITQNIVTTNDIYIQSIIYIYIFFFMASLPFLRCCGLFFHFLTEVPAPEELQSSVFVWESEFYCLLRYLGLSMNQLRPTFNDPALMELVNRYAYLLKIFNCDRRSTTSLYIYIALK